MFPFHRLSTVFLFAAGLVLSGWGLSGTLQALQPAFLSPVQAGVEEEMVLEQVGGDNLAEAQAARQEEWSATPSPLLQGEMLETAEQVWLARFDPRLGPPAPTATPLPPAIPTRIVIPVIQLDAPVIEAVARTVKLGGATYGQWKAPDRFAAGWHRDSALPGDKGNTVINGHHNVSGKVFERLVELKEGDVVILYAGERRFEYVITNRLIVPERFVNSVQRAENARWIGRSDDERLTLVTCWPKESNTHRLILAAQPLSRFQ